MNWVISHVKISIYVGDFPTAPSVSAWSKPRNKSIPKKVCASQWSSTCLDILSLQTKDRLGYSVLQRKYIIVGGNWCAGEKIVSLIQRQVWHQTFCIVIRVTWLCAYVRFYISGKFELPGRHNPKLQGKRDRECIWMDFATAHKQETESKVIYRHILE